ncbi:MAG: 16S rRNA processing protein RimM [Mycoplasmataceae bacterium]|nr:16S rRNA processing protein RimM [Mycoplasmataceae bacterium]
MNQNQNLQSKYRLIGEIVNTHGIKGDFKVILKPSNFTISTNIIKNSYVDVNGNNVYINIERVSKHKGAYLLKAKEFNNINDVENFKGYNLYSEIPFNNKEYFYYELIGMEVVNKNIAIGKVENYFLQGNFYSLTLENNNDLTIPIDNRFISNVNKEDNKIIVVFPDGYLNE